MLRYYHLLKTFKNWQLYLAYKFGFAVAQPLLFKTRNGVWVEVPERLSHTFKEIFMDECYLAGIGKKIMPNAVIIDIGANAGYFTLFAASRFPGTSIYSYEPIPVNYQQLKRHCTLNESKNISCFPLAVAGQCGNISLSFDATDSFTTSATIFSARKSEPDLLNVKCISLKKLFDDNGIKKCDLLKMDCEGAEYDIFYSCPQEYIQRIDQIAMEVHPGEGTNQNIDAMDDFFRKQGFRTCRRPVSMLWAWRS